MANLSLSHVNKVYDNGFEAVKDFNLEIEDKEFIIFVGPSGCGKSTTLRMIAGLEDISSGELKIDGKVMNDVEPKDRDIAMVFQNYALYPHMTVFDNMAFGLKLRKLPKEEIKEEAKEETKTKETAKAETEIKETKPILTYEDEEVTISITEEKEGAIPEGTTLSVTSVQKDTTEYTEVEKKLHQKAEDE